MAGHNINTGLYIEIEFVPVNRRFNITVMVAYVINPRQFYLPGIPVINAVDHFTENGIIKNTPEIYCFKTNGVVNLYFNLIRILQQDVKAIYKK